MAQVMVTLTGPNYQQGVKEIVKGAAVGTIKEARVLNFAPTALEALRGALTSLKAYFASNGIVTLFGDISTMPKDALPSLSKAAGVPVVVPGPTAMFGIQSSDPAPSQSVQAQIKADAEKQQAERWKIMQDTQTKIFEMQQETTVNRVKTSDKAHKQMSDYIRS